MKPRIFFLILIIAMTAVFSACLSRQQTGGKQQPPALSSVEGENNTVIENNQDEVATTSEETYNTSEWETFIDEKLEISVKYPKDKCRVNGSPDNSSFSIECDSAFLEFTITDWLLKNYDLKKITELNNQINGNEDEIEEIIIDNKKAYRFAINNKFYYQSLDDDFRGSGRILEGKTIIVIIVNNNEIFVVKFSDNPLSRLMFENFHFLE